MCQHYGAPGDVYDLISLLINNILNSKHGGGRSVVSKCKCRQVLYPEVENRGSFETSGTTHPYEQRLKSVSVCEFCTRDCP